MRQNPIQTIKTVLAALFVLGLIIYTGYETRDIIAGPRIIVTSPTSVEAPADGIVHVQGTAKNISYLSFNGRAIYTDITGAFDEQLLVPEGYTILELKAADRFNREATTYIRIVRQQSATS